MTNISTVILLRELQRRIKDFTGTDYDDVFENLTEETVQELHQAVNGCLDEYAEVMFQRLEQGDA